MKNLRRLLLVSSLFSLTACGNPLGNGSIVQSDHHPGEPTPVPNAALAPARGSEFVSSSAQNVPTLGHRFILQASLASPTDQIQQTTTVKNYKLFSNIQGEFISESQ